MSDSLQSIEQHLKGQKGRPPLHLWNPELSGDIDIVIKANGDWLHNGSRINRESLVKLFSTILRREEDGHYYLLTPVEKWRIQVEETALLIVDMEAVNAGTDKQSITVTTNVGDHYTLGKDHPLRVVSAGAPIVELEYKLTAKVVRAVFYRLADLAVEKAGRFVVSSAGCESDLSE